MKTVTSNRVNRSDAPVMSCPACCAKGREVNRVTLDSLLRPERRGDIAEDQYYVCATPRCDTVYFPGHPGRMFRKSDLTVCFGLKEPDGPRQVCYCFDHTVEDIHDEIRRTGQSSVVERIKADMKRSGCGCEYTNPLGVCCVKTVQATVAGAFRSIGDDEQAATVGGANQTDGRANNGRVSKKENLAVDCRATQTGANESVAAALSNSCQTIGISSKAGHGPNRVGTLTAAGSVVAATLSSACCWLPLVLIAFGASAAGVAGFFEVYRPYLTVGAVGLLGFGMYTVFFRREHCVPDSACAIQSRRLKTFNQLMLWTATALVGAFVFFPNYAGLVLGTPTEASAAVDATGLASAEYDIDGMTCEGCANVVHSALTKLPGVEIAEVDYAMKTAIVRYESERPVPPNLVIQAVKDAGYSATPTGEVP